VAETQTNLAWDTLFAIEGPPAGPLHVRLTRAIREAIRTGLLPVGSALPPTRQLAVDVGCSRWVVTEAYEQLAAEGYLEARVGSGTRVRLHDLSQPIRQDRPVVDRPPVRFDLTPGLPDFEAFPRGPWIRALRDAIATIPGSDLDYQEPGGHPRLRRIIAGYLRRVRGAVVGADDVTVTAGILDGLTLLCRAMVAAGMRRIAVEDPAWMRVVDATRRAGLQAVPVPVDADGMWIEALHATDVQAVIVAPSHQFPTGAVLSAERRVTLRDWARRTGGLVLEDDYDAEFRYDRRPVGTLQGIDPEHTVLFGSVSKTLAPAVGLGWMVTPPRWTGAVRAVEARLTGPSVLDQLAFARLIESGAYDRHLRGLRRSYRDRRDRFVTAIGRLLPDCRVSGAAAGLHVLVTLPQGVSGRAVTESAAAAGIKFKDLDECRVSGASAADGLVVGYANLDEAAVDAVLAELAAIIEAQLEETDGRVGAGGAPLPKLPRRSRPSRPSSAPRSRAAS
jgi:GntR family transcriptional regulator / MocR family aminotransferase